MLRRSSSTNYTKLQNDSDDQQGAAPQENSSSEFYDKDGAPLFIESISNFSATAKPETQDATICSIWLSVDTIGRSPFFADISKQHQLDFMAAASTLRSYIEQTPMQGRLLFRFLMCASICHVASLKFDRALINEAKPALSTKLARLNQIIYALGNPETRFEYANNPTIHAELSLINHQAAEHALAYITFLHSLSSYLEEMKTRLIHIKASLPAIIPARKARFFSPGIEDWQSELDAALKGISEEVPSNKMVTAYESSLNVLLDAKPKNHKKEFNQFKALLSNIDLHSAKPQHTAASRLSA